MSLPLRNFVILRPVTEVAVVNLAFLPPFVIFCELAMLPIKPTRSQYTLDFEVGILPSIRPMRSMSL